MVPPDSHRISRVLWYSGYQPGDARVFAYGTITLYRSTFQKSSARFLWSFDWSYNPEALASVWALPVSLAATQGISFDFFSSAYLDVSVQRVSPCRSMDSSGNGRRLILPGFPIRTPPGQCLFRLTEDYRRFRVLHRLLMPRHPPAALNYLTKRSSIDVYSLNASYYRQKLYIRNYAFLMQHSLL